MKTERINRSQLVPVNQNEVKPGLKYYVPKDSMNYWQFNLDLVINQDYTETSLEFEEKVRVVKEQAKMKLIYKKRL